MVNVADTGLGDLQHQYFDKSVDPDCSCASLNA